MKGGLETMTAKAWIILVILFVIFGFFLMLLQIVAGDMVAQIVATVISVAPLIALGVGKVRKNRSRQ